MTEQGETTKPEDVRSPGEAAHEEIDALIASVRGAADAEIAYWKARASYTAKEARVVALLYGLAVAVGTGAILAFIFGLLLVLNPRVGPILSTLIVSGAFGVISALLIFIAGRKLKALNFRGHQRP